MASQQHNAGEHNIAGEGNNHTDENAEDGSQDDISLYGPPIASLLPDQQVTNEVGYGVPEGGPNGGTFAGLVPNSQHVGDDGLISNGLNLVNLLPPHMPVNTWHNSTDVPVTDLFYLLASVEQQVEQHVEQQAKKPRTAMKKRGPQPKK